MDSRVVTLSVLALIATPAFAGGPTVFTANRLYVVGAASGTELMTEVDYSIVADGGNINTSTTIRTFSDTDTLDAPSGCAFGPNGNLYVVTGDPTAATTSRVIVYGADGTPIGTPFTAANLSGGRGIAFGPEGHFFVASSANGVVMEFDAAGTFVKNIGLGAGMSAPTGIVVGPNGNLFITDPAVNKIYEFTPIVTTAPVRTITGAFLDEPWGCAIGPRGHLFVVNHGANNVVEIDENGILVQTIGTISTLIDPEYIAIGFDGHIYVSSNGSGRVVVFDGDETPAGTPHEQIAVVGGTANVTLTSPTGIAFSPQRFGVEVAGTVYRAGLDKLKLKETFKNGVGPVVTWAPGSRFLSLSFVDNVNNTGDISSVFTPEFVFAGFQTTQDIQDNARAYAGAMIPAPNLDSGSATLALDVTGKVNAEGQFVMKEFTGRFIIQARNGIYNGKVTWLKEIK